MNIWCVKKKDDQTGQDRALTIFLNVKGLGLEIKSSCTKCADFKYLNGYYLWRVYVIMILWIKHHIKIFVWQFD